MSKAVFDRHKAYAKGTLGYHYRNSRTVFGMTKPTQFLQEKADASPNGFDEPVLQPETQMVYMLSTMHAADLKARHEKGL